MLKILGRLSSINVRKVVWAAAECGLPFETDPTWGASRPLSSEEFLALNPNGQIPVVFTPDGHLWESNTICRYFASIAGRHDLLPLQPMARANVERWMDWQATDLNGAWRPAYLAKFKAASISDETVTASLAQWRHLLLILETELERTGAYVAGDTFTLADIVLALSYQRWRHTAGDCAAFPACEAWYAAAVQRRAFIDWIDPNLP